MSNTCEERKNLKGKKEDQGRKLSFWYITGKQALQEKKKKKKISKKNIYAERETGTERDKTLKNERSEAWFDSHNNQGQ